jgi:asparagine synthase (glutamine-hydrolysing)
MCGISGIVSKSGVIKNPFDILDMGDVMQHRGPDFKGHYISPSGNLIFSHRRLSLVGLDGRSTVITIPKKNNPLHEIALVFNGEIYNFKELKKYFTEKGYTSVSPSDFEVIIFAYQEWGEKCVDHLVGEFAFVLFDDETGKIFMARDRTGVRPLFYAFTDKEFVFASEPKAVLKSTNVSNDVDFQSVAEYLLTSHAFAAGNQDNEKSFFKDVKQFPPGHYAFLEAGELNIKEYWDVPIPEAKSKVHKLSLNEALSKSVEDRITDELPMAVALSGGLDSSIIAALAVKFKSKKDVTGFCVKYTGDSNDDYQHAKIMASHLGITLKRVVVTPDNMIEYINRCIVSNDGPVDSIRRIGMLANYEAIRGDGFKVALIGEGADEFNLGYYHKFPGLKLDKEVCATAETLSMAFLGRADYVKEFFNEDYLEKVDFEKIVNKIVDKYYSKCKSEDSMDRMQYFYAKRFLQYLEDGNDRGAMTSSVEARVPFVDPDLIGVSLSIPIEDNISDDLEKRALRDAFSDMLPEQVLYRKKAPFPANEDLTTAKLISKEFKRTIAVSPQRVWDIFDKERFQKLYEDYDELISKLENGDGGGMLVSWLPLSEPVTLRTNQVFSFLTLLRWLDLYKLL